MTQNPESHWMINSYMANAVGALPLGPDGQWLPFISVGVGAISLRSDVADLSGNVLNTIRNDREPSARAEAVEVTAAGAVPELEGAKATAPDVVQDAAAVVEVGWSFVTRLKSCSGHAFPKRHSL